MAVETNIYDKNFFKNTIKIERSSAKLTVEILIKYFHPQSIIDIGCGAGVYLEKFADRGVKIIGYDGSPAAAEASLIGKRILIHDFCQPLKLKEKFDLCLCLEVAEHLNKSCAEILINTLIRLSPTIIFTAATPGQGPRSIGHINEQPRQYWVEKFEKKKFQLEKKLTNRIKKEMKENNVIWWIAKNLMVFKKSTNCEFSNS